MERHLCASADTMLDRLGGLNQYTGDGAKQKIKTVPLILFYKYLMFNYIHLQPFVEVNTSYIEKKLNQLDFSKTDKLIVIAVWEDYGHEVFREHINVLFCLKDKFKIKELRLLVNDSMSHAEFDKSQFDQIFFVDFFCYQCYYLLYYLGQKFNSVWNNESNKGLMFLGKPMRKNRIGLLYLFYQQGLLDNIKFSLYVPDHLKEITKNFLPEDISDKEYESFLNDVNYTKLDEIKYQEKEDSMHFGNGFPYDTKLFYDTSYSIISETQLWDDFDRHLHFTTEKTYKAIFNHHPFLIAGNRLFLESLKIRGYKTFENYLPYNYDIIENIDDRLRSIVEISKFFPEVLKKQKNNIEQDIKFNFLKAKKTGETVIEKLQKFFYNSSYQDIYRITVTEL